MAELSEGELPSEGSDEGELPDSDIEEGETAPSKTAADAPAARPPPSGDKFERFKVWQGAMVGNMRSAMTKLGAGIGASASSDESSGSEYEDAMIDSEIPPNLRTEPSGPGGRGGSGGSSNLLGVLGVAADQENGMEERRRKKKKKKSGAPSEWWERHKEVYEKIKERQLEISAQRARTYCKFFQKGYCKEGSDCPYMHEIRKKLDVCKYFMKNVPCHKGDLCAYMHSEFPCKYFHLRGFCYNDKECRFSHEALTEDTRQIIDFLKGAGDRGFDRDRNFDRGGDRGGFDRGGFDRGFDRGGGPRYGNRRGPPEHRHARSRSRSPIHRRSEEKAPFTEADSPGKKVLLPTPEEEERDRPHRSLHREDRGPPPGRGGGRAGFFRGRGRGSPRDGGGGGRGGFGRFNNRHSPPPRLRENGPPPQPLLRNFNSNSNGAEHLMGGFRGGRAPGGPPPQPLLSQEPGNFSPAPDGSIPAGAPFQQDDFVPLSYQRPPPPPPPPRPEIPQPEAIVHAARDPRLKAQAQAQDTAPVAPLSVPSPASTPPPPPPAKASPPLPSEPTLADMFKSLDPTASPFG